MKRNKKTALLLGLTVCLFLACAIQIGRYASQNRVLLTENRALLTENRELSVFFPAAMAKSLAVAEGVRAQFAGDVSMEEELLESSGFHKKGGIYLIDYKSQLYDLQSMIENGEEIEPGVPAATASYRLRRDLEVENIRLFSIGTKEKPFGGVFDGDRHRITGRFRMEDGAEVPEEMLFYVDASARIANLKIYNDLSGGEVFLKVEDLQECETLESDLAECPGCSIHLEMTEWEPDAGRIVEVLRGYWENMTEDGAYVSATFYPDMDKKPANAEACAKSVQEALCTLAGEEYAGAIGEALAREEGYLWFLRLERVGGLICCTFEIGEPVYEPDTYYYEGDNIVYTNVGYYIAVSGEWERKEISCQCLRIPYTQMVHSSIGTGGTYRVEEVDLNFDGKRDLLIHEGYSGGSGGSWGNYRAAVWEAETGTFVYFSSLPEQITSLEFDSRRVVDSYQLGVSYQVVEVYEVVDGEYVCTRKLVYQSGESDEGYWAELSYYEMGELVETHRLSHDNDMESLMDERYPDMDYWQKG